MQKLYLAAALLLATALPSTAQTVVVQRGESLSEIAARELGDSSRWTEICQINAEALNSNCDLLVVGQSLAMPSNTTNEEASQPAPSTSPAPSSATTSAAIEIPVVLFSADGVETSSTDALMTGVANQEPGARRLKYSFGSIPPGFYQGRWSFELQGSNDLSVLVFNSELGVLGRANLTKNADGIWIGNSYDAVTSAKVTTGTGALSELLMSFEIPKSDRQTIVMLYPTGPSEDVLNSTVEVKFAPFVLTAD